MRFDKAEFFTSFGTPSQLPAGNRPEIVFSGRSNVGKSSLINRLCSRKALARVSGAPGKTATINFYTVDSFYLVDLPGYGFARVSKGEKRRWADLMEGYFHDPSRDIALVVQLLDVRHSPSRDDLQMVDFLIENELPFLAALTKTDKLSAIQLAARIEEFKSELPCGDQITLVPVSARSGAGMDELRGMITEILA